ncbi:hypothetical protein ACFR97_14375 [Haloplanus litoreus]|uniref:Uncharacterized protein n=1 Tax=Haloplanus litoreus TaxID=767515 RepID=A0ABD5ZXR9_9EURY
MNDKDSEFELSDLRDEKYLELAPPLLALVSGWILLCIEYTNIGEVLAIVGGATFGSTIYKRFMIEGMGEALYREGNEFSEEGKLLLQNTLNVGLTVFFFTAGKTLTRGIAAIVVVGITIWGLLKIRSIGYLQPNSMWGEGIIAGLCVVFLSLLGLGLAYNIFPFLSETNILVLVVAITALAIIVALNDWRKSG